MAYVNSLVAVHVPVSSTTHRHPTTSANMMPAICKFYVWNEELSKSDR